MADDTAFMTLILALTARLDRLPTEDEVMSFVYGDEETRKTIWNRGAQ